MPWVPAPAARAIHAPGRALPGGGVTSATLVIAVTNVPSGKDKLSGIAAGAHGAEVNIQVAVTMTSILRATLRAWSFPRWFAGQVSCSDWISRHRVRHSEQMAA